MFAVVGTGGYWLLYRTDWRNPFLLLYDVPTLGLSFSLGGSVVGRLILQEARSGDVVRLPLLLTALVLALGVRYCGWPFSGHLLWAWTVALLEAGDAQNPLWFRFAVFVPALLLILIRTFRPQIPLMATHAYTVTALLLGTILGVGGLVMLARWGAA
jgi:hypothetical protein